MSTPLRVMEAAKDAASVFGVISGVFGLVAFFLNNLPDHNPKGAAVRIKAARWAQNAGGIKAMPDLAGSLDKIWGYDHDDIYMGYSKGGHIAAGGVLDVTIDQKIPGVQLEYIGILAKNDAVCIQWITVKQFDSVGMNGVWTGDIGARCPGTHTRWYYSNQESGQYKSNTKDGHHKGDPYYSRCTWFDNDGTNGYPITSMKFNTLAYGSKVEEIHLSNAQCQYTSYGTNHKAIESRPGKILRERNATLPDHTQPEPITSPQPTPPAPKQRLPWMKEHLIVSKIKDHTAAELCSTPSTWGPDLIGSDGKFCDMDKHEVHPLCETEAVPGCITLDKANMKLKKRGVLGRRVVDEEHKTYGSIADW